MFCVRARLSRLRKTHALYPSTTFQAAKNSCFVSEHDFPGCGKTHVLYQGTTFQAAEGLMFCIRARLSRLQKD